MGGAILVRWPGGERTFEDSEVVTIGRDRSCSIVLNAQSVSRNHAEIRFQNGVWVLTDLNSTQGTHQHGGRVASLELLSPSTLVLGDPATGERLEITPPRDERTEVSGLEAASPTTIPGERPGGALRSQELVGATVVTGQTLSVACGGATRSLEPGQKLIIGRDPECDLTSANPTVSRQHVRISFDGTSWNLEDLSSSGGTYLDGKRIKATPLTGSMAVWLGDPETGERVVLVASGQRQISPVQKLERKFRAGRGTLVAVVVAVLALAAGLIALFSRGGASSDDTLARATVLIRSRDQAFSYTGSGTIIDAKRGLILTNAHVAAPQADGLAVTSQQPGTSLHQNLPLTISVSPGRDRAAEPKFTGTVVAADGYLDLAIVKITGTVGGAAISTADLKGLTQISLGDSDKIHQGETIRVVGYPALANSLTPTLTRGVMTSTQRDPRLAGNRAWINTDADVNHGNSGGLAADDSGHIIGIPSQIIPDVLNASKVDVIRPINFAKALVAAARAGQPYTSPYIRPLTNERIDNLTFVAVQPPAGLTLGCQAAVARKPSPGDNAVSVALDYSGFASGQHQDMLVEVAQGDFDATRQALANTTVLGTASVQGQYPVSWQSSGCAVFTMQLKDPLASGKATAIEVFLGPHYDIKRTIILTSGSSGSGGPPAP